MNHAEVQATLEVAATEPGGVDAFLRGGSAEAQDVSGHLATCDPCRAELAELRASAATIRDVIRSTPSPELRARTMELIAAADRQVSRPSSPRRRFTLGPLRPLLPAAAVSALAAAAIAGVVVWRSLDSRITEGDARIAEQRTEIAALSAVADWTMRLGAAPDAQLIRLAPPGPGGGTGTVILSADRGELVMLASGLPAPPAGYEYRCWIDQGSGRERIGKLYRIGAVDYWGGAVERIRGLEGPFTLGVSLVSRSDGSGGEAVLQSSQ